MRTSFLRAPTADSLLLQGLLYEPDGPCAGAVLHVHGMAGNFYENRFLDVMARVYTDAGFALLAGNTRGHDMIGTVPLTTEPPSSARCGVAYERFADSAHDLAAWLDVLAARLAVPLVIQGHSLGGSKAVHYVTARDDDRVAGVVLLSSTEMIQYAEVQADYASRLTEARALLSDGCGDQLLAGLVWDDAYVMSAATYVDFTTRGNPIDVVRGYAPDEPAPLGAVRQPVLAVMGRSDEGVGAIGTTAEDYLALLERKATGSANVETYAPDCNHGYRGAEEDVAQRVAGWLARLG